MATLPVSDGALFIRTYFGDPAAWKAICEEVRKPADEYTADFAEFAAINAMIGQDVGDGPQAYVTIVDDATFADLVPEQLIELLPLLPPDRRQAFLFVVDEVAHGRPDHPILIVDCFEQEGRTFRAVPSQIQVIENNLSIANCDWEDFADNVDEDGVFRGAAE